MCKEVGAYPKCAACPSFVPPDPTPGVMTWEELLTHMDNLADWGQDQLKAWGKQAGLLQVNGPYEDKCPFGYGEGCGGGGQISSATKAEVANILNGILSNLSSHKALVAKTQQVRKGAANLEKPAPAMSAEVKHAMESLISRVQTRVKQATVST